MTAASALLGELNQDEGWYLYAARLITEGQLPYVHFASTQGPLLPLVYAAGFPLIREYGVLGGRELTTLFAFIALFVSCAAAWRLAPDRARPLAALLTLMLLGLNVYHSYFTSMTKTYALTSMWLVCGFLALADAKGNFWKALLAGAYLGLAAATRISAGAIGPVVGCVLLWGAWRKGGSRSHAWLGLAIGWGIGLGAVLIPFWWRAPEAFQFGMFEYHTARDVGGLIKGLVYKVGFIARVLHAYFVPVTVACVALFLSRLKKEAPNKVTVVGAWPKLVVQALWLGSAAVTLVHLSAPFPYDDYEVIVAPLFCIGTAVLVAGQLTHRREHQERIALAVGVLCVAGCLASPMVEGWFVGERDRIWWPMKDDTSLGNLKQTADKIKTLAGKQTVMLTQDLYLAVEAGLHVPAGLEMGPFSYFPDMSDQKAKACHVLNRAMMAQLLATSTEKVAAWSDYGLAIQCPSVTPIPIGERAAFWTLITERYEQVEDVKHFGQARTALRILTRKPEADTRGSE